MLRDVSDTSQSLPFMRQSPEEFAAMFPSGANYVPGISWNPTNAQFWDQFNADPAVANLGNAQGIRGESEPTASSMWILGGQC